MEVTLGRVVQILTVDEPDYDAGVALGHAALPHLKALAEGPDIAIAVKAVYLASLIGGDQADAVVITASRSEDPLFRVVAAAALNRLSTDAMGDIAERLVMDADPAVRRRAIRSIPLNLAEPVSRRLEAVCGAIEDEGDRASLLDALAHRGWPRRGWS